MSKTISIMSYEFKIQLKKLAGWLMLVFSLAVALLDCLPTASNIARIEFLTQPSYYMRRILMFSGLLLLFGLMFLLSGRMRGDKQNGVKELFMAAPITKAQYVMGKLLGNFLYALAMMAILLLVCLAGFAILSPEPFDFAAFGKAFLTAFGYIAVPACFFVAACSVILPDLMDIRLFYLLFSVLFLVNAFTVNSGERLPFYLITQGDLSKLVWRHPKYPALYWDAVLQNLLFMLGLGGIAPLLIMAKRKFWRAD